MKLESRQGPGMIKDFGFCSEGNGQPLKDMHEIAYILERSL